MMHVTRLDCDSEPALVDAQGRRHRLADRRARDQAYYAARKARANRRCACGALLAPTSLSRQCHPCAATNSAPLQAAVRVSIRRALAVRHPSSH